MNNVQDNSDPTVMDQEQDQPVLDPFEALEDAQAVAERFQDNFGQLLQNKIAHTVQEVLEEEFPKLAADADFVKKVCQKLDHQVVEEKRFVFLSLNPKYKQEKV